MSQRPAGRPLRPAALVFDVLDTLFPLAPLEWRFREAGIPRVLMARWSAHLLRDSFALALASGGDPGGSGAPRPVDRSFEDVARGALRDITGHQIAPSAEDAVIEGMAGLDPRPEAAAALLAARGAGLGVATLSNHDDALPRTLLERAGLLELVEDVLAVRPAREWKPTPGAYHAAARSLGVPPERLALVTAHGWDVAGAGAARLVTGWSSHLEGRFPPVFAPPDVSGRDLAETVDGLLALSG
ncbi:MULTISPECIES: HAD family hydrolase [Nocardiopsis]|uniref:Haloacid dehalogenase n=1 Tax=Nocardiopsis sinuspersici TaxID=501010 RepID=A0A1V3C6Z1_9ACTN|nr:MULTISPECIES: HAD family hydrolase [Nocardiopsis]OOC56515.1 haloacid dehalogenase [Nocardiopsis sinuspersici]